MVFIGLYSPNFTDFWGRSAQLAAAFGLKPQCIKSAHGPVSDYVSYDEAAKLSRRLQPRK
jgi:hypothetical protein